MKFCTNCGNQVPEGANVCPLCGTPLGGQPNFQQQTQRKLLSYQVHLKQPHVLLG